MRRLLFSILVMTVACGSTSNATTTESTAVDSGTPVGENDAGRDTPPSTMEAGVDSSAPAAPLTVFTILMENHDYAEIVGSPNAPYFNQLIDNYGLATKYQDSGVHPSLPNYLDLISGDPQYIGIVDLTPTESIFPVKKDNLGTQLEAAKIPWRSYQESMGSPCGLQDSGDYAPKHDPFLYFADMQASAVCNEHNVDYSNFAGDLAAGTYRYMWITPNLTDDGHNPTTDPVAALKTCDAWAAANIPTILESAAFKANGILFITWDEAEGRNGDSKEQIPLIVVTPRIKSKGYKSTTTYTHASYLATIEDLFGLPRLPTVTSLANFSEFWQ